VVIVTDAGHVMVLQNNYNCSNNNATAWNSRPSNEALNKPCSVSFNTPSHANAAVSVADALSPDADSAKFRLSTLDLCATTWMFSNHPPECRPGVNKQ